MVANFLAREDYGTFDRVRKVADICREAVNKKEALKLVTLADVEFVTSGILSSLAPFRELPDG